MTVDVVSYMLSNEEGRERLKFQIILQCAPFLKRMKVASIMNIEKRLYRELEAIFQGTDIEYRILTVNQERCLVFFFRREELENYLSGTKVRQFLKRYGYADRNLEQVLYRLSKRVCQYSCRAGCFPHEIGAFLNYPLDDVQGFIEQSGKGELLSGYWKVYSHPGRARMIFLAYDKARLSAVNEYLIGKSIREIQSGAEF